MGNSNSLYDQQVKADVRNRILRHAVNALTSDRSESPVVSIDRFNRGLEYCIDFIRRHARQDIRPHLEAPAAFWGALQESRVGVRSPVDLNVLFLCGPNPLNDFQVLMGLGIPPQNVWAVEGGTNEFDNAVKELRTAELPVNIDKGALHEFFEVVPQQFDLVYFDACGPLFGGKPKTAQVLRELFINQRLAPLSVLITNFSQANADGNHTDEWLCRMAVWYAARFREPCSSPFELPERRLEFPAYAKFVGKNLGDYYSDFVSRFTIEFASLLLPWWRVSALPAARREYFASREKLAQAIDDSMSVPTKIDLETLSDGFGTGSLCRVLSTTMGDTAGRDGSWRAMIQCDSLFCKDTIRGQKLSDSVKVISLVRSFYESYQMG